jgi:uncharacterized protein DUF3533
MPITEAVLVNAVSQLATQGAAQYLASIAGNETAIKLLARAPQTIANPVYFQLFNLRPYAAPVATAVTLVGFIYVIILRYVLSPSIVGVSHSSVQLFHHHVGGRGSRGYWPISHYGIIHQAPHNHAFIALYPASSYDDLSSAC